MASLTQLLTKEIEREVPGTRKILERIPEDKLDWQPHTKSMTIRTLASHIVSLAGWPGIITTTNYWDIAENPLKATDATSVKDILAALENAVRHSINGLQSLTDDDLEINWVLKRGELIILSSSKAQAIRLAAMNHLYHHRGQMSVYLRLLDIPVPGIYGPSFDDKVYLK